ncbi:maleylpyruvate isomerase family mycothiol-dependent enzyme [Aeromicrobium stalagmiti]|uniref:maleylpyruvate isomerase family mycothiol-dependent enzyme n=1 Tax=Aeromicrobium stalagmiti TaxID=2738988 RepID=UPI00156A128D|nr:maleylpyruvate isomerase family mycothiol-dependent enzyme [Aeromicrobium stalagmiti]NRQ49687.1 maleylpyruvate isomerase family mycothiol-dependent enzyme [Aeromicrobium stalagmiti]
MDHALELGTAMARFAELAGLGTGEEPVPACEGWTTRDLAEHLGTVHRWAGSILLSGQRLASPKPVVTEPVSEWYSATASALLGAIQAVSPDEAVPNFTRMGETAAFWPRRQMHETIVHGVDAAQALGFDEDEWTVAPQIAADGIDEVLQVFFPRMTARGVRPDVRSRIRLVATDLEQSWLVGPGEGESGTPLQLHASREADATVTGLASDLYLALWHRVSRFRLEFDGPDGIALLDGPTTP